MSGIKLELGCADRPQKPDFVGCDIRQVGDVQIVCAAWELRDHVEPNTIEEIYNRHMFEHLTFHQGDMALECWFDVLQSGGRVEMELPDFEYHIRQYLDSNSKKTSCPINRGMTNHKHAKGSIFGWQRDEQSADYFTGVEMWNVHKSGYNFQDLKEKLEKHNFINIKKLPSDNDPWNLRVEFYKP